jgi:spore coat protein CotF
MPLTILAGINAAAAAIQQGCELYKEYKGTVLEAKKSFDEAKGIVLEVAEAGNGIWSFLKSKLFPSEEPPKPVSSVVKKAEDKPQEVSSYEGDLDEDVIKSNLVKNLKVVFKGMIALDKKIKQQQEIIDTQEIDPDKLLDMSLDHVIAQKEMARIQKELRETMVYQSPPELGALYTDVISMFDLVKEKQEVTHLLNIRKRKEEYQHKYNIRSKIRHRISWVIVVFLIVVEIWGLILSIHLARHYS